MKQVFLILCSFYFVLSSLSQTTEEEYLYVTFGYKEQLLKGLDDKDGYMWKAISEYVFTNNGKKIIGKKTQKARFEFEGLFRIGEEAPCAIVVIFKEEENMKKQNGIFFCIPHPESPYEIIRKAESYFKKEIGLNRDLLMYYGLATGNLAIMLAQKG